MTGTDPTSTSTWTATSTSTSTSTATSGEPPAARLTLPRLVIAAPASGQGKTSITTGLLAALRQAGHVVSPHKVGPDYIDPSYHALAAGRPGRNLDPWLVGPERIVPMLVHGATTPTPADVAVVEGVMGLFDGVVGRGSFGSTAHVASLIGAPVVLVVDTASTSRSVAATLHGFATFDPSVRVAGVILNRVGSDRHEQIMRDACDEVGMPVLGSLRRVAALHTPSRHLGLVPVGERTAEAQATVDALAQVVRDSVDLAAVMALARTAPDLPIPADRHAAPDLLASPPAPSSVSAVMGGSGPGEAATRGSGPIRGSDAAPIVAVAGGPAFTFGYAEHPELLAAAGADVVAFDPLTDRLPVGTAALVIGGGFPEVYAERLSDNAVLTSEIAGLVRSGGPVVAECAGLLYLARSLDGRPMCGVLPTDAVMTSRLTLGYREAVAMADGLAGPVGTRVRGHEFHRTSCDPPAGATPAWTWAAPVPAHGAHTDGFVAGPTGAVHASYLHLHWAGVPGLVDRFMASARLVQNHHPVGAP